VYIRKIIIATRQNILVAAYKPPNRASHINLSFYLNKYILQKITATAINPKLVQSKGPQCVFWLKVLQILQ